MPDEHLANGKLLFLISKNHKDATRLEQPWKSRGELQAAPAKTPIRSAQLLNPCLLCWTGCGAASAAQSHQPHPNSTHPVRRKITGGREPASLRSPCTEHGGRFHRAQAQQRKPTAVTRFQHQQASETTSPKQRAGGRAPPPRPCLGLPGLQKKMRQLSRSAGFLNDPKAHKCGSRLSSHLHQCKSVTLKSVSALGAGSGIEPGHLGRPPSHEEVAERCSPLPGLIFKC